MSEKVKPIKTNRIEGENQHLYLFCSIDLTNSTIVKHNSTIWVGLVELFYKSVNEELQDSWEVWKFAGDEVILKKAVEELKEISKIVNDLFIRIKTISNATKKKSEELNGHYSSLIKTTLWCSTVTELNANLDEIKLANSLYTFKTQYDTIDYIGPEMDLGFRICKYSFPSFITVSALLTRILLYIQSQVGTDYFNVHFYLLDYVELKGVWNNRKYPIILMSCNSINDIEITDIPYDLKYNNSLFLDIIIEKQNNPQKEDVLKKVDEEFFKSINSHVPFFNNTYMAIEKNATKLRIPKIDNYCRVDAVAICFNLKRNKVLLAKKMIRNVDDGEEKMMFGAVELKNNNLLEESLMEEYKKDFNLEIDLYKEKGNLQIVSYLQLENDYNTTVLIFAATAKEDDFEKNNDGRGYNKIGWYDIDKNGKLKDELKPVKFVKDFDKNLEKAYFMIKD